MDLLLLQPFATLNFWAIVATLCAAYLCAEFTKTLSLGLKTPIILLSGLIFGILLGWN